MLVQPGKLMTATQLTAEAFNPLRYDFRNLALNETGWFGNKPGTFSRSSQARQWNSSGVLEYAPHNLQVYSEAFDNAEWTKNRASIATGATDPNGGTTAFELVEDSTASNSHRITDGITLAADGDPHKFTIWVKGNTRDWIYIRTHDGTTVRYVWFDVTNGTVGTEEGSNTGTITSVGNGWYKCEVLNPTAQASNDFQIGMATGDGNITYNGDGSSSVYLWRCQARHSNSPDTYIKTTSSAVYAARGGNSHYKPVTNLLSYSEQFDNAAWNKQRASVSANTSATTDPRGGNNADKLVEDSTASNNHRVYYQLPVVSGKVYTFSAYAKAAERSFIELACGGTGFGGDIGVIGDLSAGTGADGSGSPDGFGAIACGNGWYRLYVTATATTTGTADLYVYIQDALGNKLYSGDGSSGLYIYGAMLNEGGLEDYVQSVASATTGFVRAGLLIEGAATNICLQSEDISTTWTNNNSTETTNATTAPDGTTTADALREDGTAADTHYVTQSISFDGSSSYVYYTFLKAANRTFARLAISDAAFPGTVSAYYDLSAGTVGTTANTDDSGIIPVGDGWYLCWMSATSNAAASSSVFIFAAEADNDVVFDGLTQDSIYCWGMQVETGTYPSEYIPTTSSSVTYADNLASILTSAFAYNSDEGSIVVQGIRKDTTATVASLNDGTANEIIEIEGDMNLNVVDGGASQVAADGGAVPADVKFKVAIAWKANDFAISINGATAVTDTSGTIPTPTVLDLFQDQAGNVSDGYLETLDYYNTRLPNATLQAKSTITDTGLAA